MPRARLCWLVVVAAALALPGCKRGPAYKVVPVRGKLTYRGKGVKAATVQLVPDAARGTHAPTATGQTGADGSFTLQTPPHGPGAVPGHYKVTVQEYVSSGVPAKYGNPAQTPLHIDIPDAGLPDWDLKIPD